MGYWENTTYIKHGKAADVADALVVLFEMEGMRRIARPAQRARPHQSPMQYRSAAENDLWAAAIAPGAPSWCIVKTAPMELLAERPAGRDRMRLAEICVALSTSAVQVNVYDDTGFILVEVSGTGEVLVSGFDPDPRGEDMLDWNGERLSAEFLEPQFRLHPFQDLVSGETLLGDDLARAIGIGWAEATGSIATISSSFSSATSRCPRTTPSNCIFSVLLVHSENERMSCGTRTT